MGEMVQAPDAKEEVLEATVVKLKETLIEKVNELPLEEVIEMAEDSEAEIPILMIAAEKIKEIEDPSAVSDPVIKEVAMDMPIETLLEMAKDPKAKQEILDAAVIKLEE